jgi:hypothetical protein
MSQIAERRRPKARRLDAPIESLPGVQCVWNHPLSAEQIARLIKAEGDCVLAGMPCTLHGNAITHRSK